jgi:hypothetical protein
MKVEEQQEYILELLDEINRKENEFPIIDKNGKVLFPVLSRGGIRIDWEEKSKGLKNYRGICVEINDHGNVTVWNCFKNGKRKEIVSRV